MSGPLAAATIAVMFGHILVTVVCLSAAFSATDPSDVRAAFVAACWSVANVVVIAIHANRDDK